MLMRNSGNPISLEGLENRVDPVAGSLGIPFNRINPLCMVRDWLRCQKTGDRARANFLMRMLAALPGEMP